MLTNLTPQSLSTEFCRRLRGACPDLAYRLVGDGDPVLSIPERHPEVGPIMVSFDGEEITIVIGKLYHVHFECSRDISEPEPSSDSGGIAKAVKWISSFLNDEIILEVWHDQDRISGGSTYTKEIFNRADVPSNARLFTWSGPWAGR